MTSVLDQQVSGQAAALLGSNDGDGNGPPQKPFQTAGRAHEEETSEDCKSLIERRNDEDTRSMLTTSDISLQYEVGEDETCPVCGKHKGPHKQLQRCKICNREHAGICREICNICGSGKHSTKHHREPVKSSTDDAANFARFISTGLTSAWNHRYGGVTKPGQSRGQGRGRGRGQRGGQNRSSGRGQGRGQHGDRGRARGNPNPNGNRKDGDKGPDPNTDH